MSNRRFFPRPAIEASFNRWDWALLPLVLAVLVLLAMAAAQMARPFHLGEALPLSLDPAHLPYYLLRTTLRMFIALGAFGWLTLARIVRAQVMSLKEREFVEAATSLGLSRRRILFRHIIPNTLGPVIVYTTLTVPSFIMYEASLSYLGLGIESPNSSWGILIQEGANFLETQPLLLIIPGIFFSLTLLALNFLGDGLRDALDVQASKD